MTEIPTASNDPPRPAMTLERLRGLLDAYGARPERWPDDERQAALALLATSREAAALQAAAARLDAALDRLPTPAPSAELMARVLARAPGAGRAPRLPSRSWRLVGAAVPLAAAAALLLWLWTGHETAKPIKPEQFATNYLGGYTMPTDVLLVPPGLDVSRSGLTLGCSEGDLGCPALEAPTTERQSLRNNGEREYG